MRDGIETGEQMIDQLPLSKKGSGPPPEFEIRVVNNKERELRKQAQLCKLDTVNNIQVADADRDTVKEFNGIIDVKLES